MKKIFSTLSLAALILLVMSCREEELGPTIFPVIQEELDVNSPTYQLDKFVYDNYLTNYNMRFDYKMKDTEVNMDYNLVPTSYAKSVDMAVLTKYLWYDVYNKVVENSTDEAKDKFFMKRYGPKMIVLVGSPAINATTGTEERGLAEGGVKITLYAMNEMDINDLESLNDLYFRVMHHEFSHILNQSKLFTLDFEKISQGLYDPLDWQTKDDREVRSKGFITAYGSSNYSEDFVEFAANYIVSTDNVWEQYLEDATYGYERVENITPYEVRMDMQNNILLAKLDSVMDMTGEQVSSYTVLRYSVQRDESGNIVLVDGKPVFEDNDGVDGKAILEKKLSICKDYYKENFGITLDAIRDEVLDRMYVKDSNGDFVLDNAEYVNKLTFNDNFVMDSLRNQVYGINK